MNIPSLLLLIALSLILITAPRRFFLFPYIVAACLVPMDQRFAILNLDFTLLRVLILIGVLRLAMRGEFRAVKWNTFDKLILSWLVIGSLVYIAQHANYNSVILRSGVLYDSIGMYWLFRQAVRSWEDVFQAIKVFALLAIFSAPLIALERFYNYSFFTILGDAGGSFHRGRFRAAGPFPHYIIMGCFWTTLLSLFYARIKSEKDTVLYWLAIIASLSNIYFSASSTPILTLVAILLFWKIYYYRIHGEVIVWATCSFLLFLHLIMKAPVWHLMARVDIFEGSTGWHRYFLFDNFIKNTSEWFFLGTKSTAHWGHAQWDLTNQFVLEGVRGGIITLVVFVSIIYLAIKIPAKFSLQEINNEIKWLSWGICAAMFGHFTTFWGVSYFGQINMLLFFTLALVGFVREGSHLAQAEGKIAPKRRVAQLHKLKIRFGSERPARNASRPDPH